MPEATLIAEWKPSRIDGLPFPIRAPEGWVHLSIATAKLSHALLGADGDRWEYSFADTVMLALGLPNADPDMSENWEWIAAQAVSVFANETVLTGYRQTGGGGPVTPMPGSWWDLEDLFLRFRTWSIDPDNLASPAASLPCWIWVQSDSLERQLRLIAQYRGTAPVPVGLPAPFWISLPDALGVVSRLSPSVGSPAAFIAALCGANMIEARALLMTRCFAGKEVEREQIWRVPQFAWQLMGHDVRSTPSAGLIYARVGQSEYLIEGVHLNREALLTALTLKGYAPAPRLVAPEDGGQAPEAPAPTATDKKKPLPEADLAKAAADFVAENGRTPNLREFTELLEDKFPQHETTREQRRTYTKRGRDGRPRAS
jgi:hypothetical protein